MGNNLLQPYAADACARLYKRRSGEPFNINELPKDIKRSALKANQMIEKVGGVRGTIYKFTPRAVGVMKRRGLI